MIVAFGERDLSLDIQEAQPPARSDEHAQSLVDHAAFRGNAGESLSFIDQPVIEVDVGSHGDLQQLEACVRVLQPPRRCPQDLQ